MASLDPEHFIHQIKNYKYRPLKSNLKRASVSIILIEKNKDFDIVFVQRSQNLREHAGQIAFPGGRVEDTDSSLKETAIRECFEESHIDLRKAEFINRSDDFISNSNYHISPHIFRLEERPEYILSGEHEFLFFAPVSHLMDEKNRKVWHIEHEAKTWIMHDFFYQEFRIWGVSGWILNNFFSIQASYSSLAVQEMNTK